MQCWKFYFPEDAETADDAVEITRESPSCAEAAAQYAVEWDFHNRDGYMRLDEGFDVAVVSPSGEETRWRGLHERTIHHSVMEAT